MNYGQGGVQNGANIAFTVPANGMDVVFQWNSITKELRVIVGGIHGDLTKAQAYWLSADTIAWNVPTDTVVTLFADPDGALTLDGPGVVAGHELAAPGRSRTIRRVFRPRCARSSRTSRTSRRSSCRPSAVAAAAQSLKGQLAVGAARPGQGVDATSLQIPGVLDDLYSAKAGAAHARARASKHGTGDPARLGADRAQPAAAPLRGLEHRRRSPTHPMTLDPASGIWSYTAPAGGLARQVLPVRGAGLRALDEPRRDQRRHRSVLGLAGAQQHAQPDRLAR